MPDTQEPTPIPTPTIAPEVEKQPDYRRQAQRLEKELQLTTVQLNTVQEQLEQRTQEVEHIRTLHGQQHQYYQTALLTIVENLKVMMRTIAILAGKVE